MDIAELQRLARQTREHRERNVALLIASALLATSFAIPVVLSYQNEPEQPITIHPEWIPFPEVVTEAKAAIVYDLATGKTLYEKNADAQLPLASLTKLLTVYAALSELPPDTPITIPPDALLVETPRAFNEGQTFALSDIARLTLTASLNDGAAAIAEATALHENRTQNEMLAGAAGALGLTQTFALNGSGLDVSASLSGAYGSARDLARLAGALYERASAIAAATTEKVARATSAGGTSYTVKNTDPIVGSIPRLLLSKTGLTDLAGGNLALVFDSAIRHPIAVVVLGSSKSSRFTDGQALVAATLQYFASNL